MRTRMWPLRREQYTLLVLGRRIYKGIPGAWVEVDSPAAVVFMGSVEWVTYDIEAGAGLTEVTASTIKIVYPLDLDLPVLEPGGWSLAAVDSIVSLGVLWLSSSPLAVGAAQGDLVGLVLGAISGSTVEVGSINAPGSLQIVQVLDAWEIQVGPAPPDVPVVLSLSLVETLAGAVNSPRITTGITINVDPGVDVLRETWASRLVRLRGQAVNNNPIESPPLVGSVAWVTGAVTAAGAVVSNAGNVYKTIAGGTNGATAPTHITGSVTDGAVLWVWQGRQTAPVLSALSTTHDSSYTRSYAITSLNYVDNVAPFRWRGGVPQVAFTGTAVRSVNNSPGAGNLGGTFAGQNGSLTFVFEGTSCEVAIRDASLTRVVNIIVNGRYLDSTVKLVNGGVSYFKIDFTNVSSLTGISAAPGFQRNTVTIDGKDGQIFNGVNCLPTGTLSYPDTTDNFTAVYIGDSQGGGGGPAPVAQANFSWQMMHMMGLPDMQNCSIGGTGFVSAATGYPNYSGHTIADLQYQNTFRPIGLIFIQLSANDHDVTGLLPVAGLAAASMSFFQSLRVTFPGIPIVATGLVTGGAVALSVHQAIEAIHAANIATLQAAGDAILFYVPAARDPNGAWITGTGNAGSPNGTGNADFNITSDNLHMSVAGNSLYARRAMNGFLNQIPQP